MVHARGCRSRTRPPTRGALPFLYRALRLCVECQFDSWSKHHHSHRNQWMFLHLYDLCTGRMSAVAIPEFVFRRYLVSGAEIAWPPVQRSEFKWSIETCELDNG